MDKRVLVLGGTAEARALANQLHEAGVEVMTSLAGRTDNPLLPDGKTRIGGFGGAEGLAGFMDLHRTNLLVDATHPFATQISKNAAKAAAMAGIDIMRLERPAWQPAEGDLWHVVQSLEEAVATLPEASTVFVTIGRQQLSAFVERDDLRVVARAIEGPKISLPDHWTVLLDRPPFSLEDEIALFKKHHIDVLVTKNAGGEETRAKLLAARALSKPVIVIDRLPKPAVETVDTVEAALKKITAF